jgi:hypothetical protein
MNEDAAGITNAMESGRENDVFGGAPYIRGSKRRRACL